MTEINKLKKDLKQAANPKQAKILQGFFKTGKGEYGEGDIFLGIKVPVLRKFSKKYWQTLSVSDIKTLLTSKIHEERMLALYILILQYKKGDEQERKNIFDFYLKHTKYINNWDLVDVSTPNIVGDYLLDKDRKILYKLVRSKDLWERRISIMACFTFIRNNDYKDALKISEILLKDDHDLIHKAVGWMLREVGNRNMPVEEKFLKKHYKKMARTMLRYAIEKFPEPKRKYYLNKK